VELHGVRVNYWRILLATASSVTPSEIAPQVLILEALPVRNLYGAVWYPTPPAGGESPSETIMITSSGETEMG